MRSNRAIQTIVVLALGLGLAGCENLDDFFNSKKPLQGERKAVFPEGVPGVPQGVPQDLVKGYQPPAEPEPQVAAAPVERPKPKPRPKRVAAPKRPPAAQPAAQQSGDSAFPTPPSQTAARPAAAQSSPPVSSPWPEPPRSGTFSR